MRWRLAVVYVLLLITAIGGLGLFVSNYVYNTYLDMTRAQLLSKARLLAQQAEPLYRADNRAGLHTLAGRAAAALDARVTLILPDGTVAGDSSADPAQMENHANRLEVQQALNGLEASDVRFSQTLSQSLLYAAVPVQPGAALSGVVRLAAPLDQLQQSMNTLRSTLLFATLITALLAVGIAMLLGSRITRPLQRLTARVVQMTPGSTAALAGDEIEQLNSAFQQLSSRLSSQIEALQTEQGTLEAVLANMADGVLMVTPQGGIQLINAAARRLFEVPEGAEVMGRSLIEITRLHQPVELWQRSQKTGETVSSSFETTASRLFLQGIATPLSGGLEGSTLLLIQDLTRMRRLEMVRRDFVSNVSHELRTPLASLKALTETLAEGALEDPPAARRFLTHMENEIDNLTQMVQELLELSRIESGKVPLDLKTVKPCDLVRPAVERMQMQAGRAGLTLTLTCGADLPAVRADRSRMEQVLVNLLHNAIKFTPPGGEISVSVVAQTGGVAFSVRDTGVGIAPEDLPRIFERFYKADRARSGGGTGLGLSIARHMVEAHGGSIRAESAPGQGAVFTFVLPAER